MFRTIWMGIYRVFNPEEFGKGRKVLLWGGMWKTDRREPKLICDFIEQNEELAPKIVKFIEQFTIFLAPIGEDKRISERIEVRNRKKPKSARGNYWRFSRQGC